MAATKKQIDVRYLSSEQTEILWGFDELLYVVVKKGKGEEDELYRGVFAVLSFPVTFPNNFLSLRYYNQQGQELEVGIIRDPADFPAEARNLLARSLAGYYFEFEVERVLKIELKYNLLMFDVVTNHGPRQFEMRWEGERALDLGVHGKVLLDVFDCRYVIRDIRALPPADRELFTRYIYW